MDKNKSNRSLFNQSNSLSMKSSSGVRSAGGLNSISTLQRSTKTETGNSSTQRPLQNVRAGAKDARTMNLSKDILNQGSQNQLSSFGSAGTVGHTKEAREERQDEEAEAASAPKQVQSFNKEQQEYFLAKALHFGIIYLPSESPLVQHLTQNYIKNYLQ